MRAVHLLRHEHAIIILCRVLNVNRSSYYKHFNSKESKRAIENRKIKNCILQIYSEAIIDLFSRRVIAYKLGKNIDTKLVLDTFESALKNRDYPKNVIFHSDRGSQYTSDEFRKRLDRASFLQSFSKKGHPYDNAVAEAFFKFLKLEETNRRSYSSFDELELSIFEYIHFYNFNRPHSANNLLSPIQFEALF